MPRQVSGSVWFEPPSLAVVPSTLPLSYALKQFALYYDIPPTYWVNYCLCFDKFVWNFFIPITFIIFSRFNICVFMFLDEKMLIFLMHNFIYIFHKQNYNGDCRLVKPSSGGWTWPSKILWIISKVFFLKYFWNNLWNLH